MSAGVAGHHIVFESMEWFKAVEKKCHMSKKIECPVTNNSRDQDASDLQTHNSRFQLILKYCFKTFAIFCPFECTHQANRLPCAAAAASRRARGMIEIYKKEARDRSMHCLEYNVVFYSWFQHRNVWQCTSPFDLALQNATLQPNQPCQP